MHSERWRRPTIAGSLDDAVGLTHMIARVARPTGRGPSARIRFLVDTGAVYTVLPEHAWQSLRLRPTSSAEFGLADGSAIARPVSEARFDVAGRAATSPVILGERDDAPLLGAVTLETLGLMVNPLTREIVLMGPLPMYRLRVSAAP